MMKVFVLDKDHKPLMPCGPARARKLLKAGRARVHKLQPFTIRIVDRSLADSVVQKVVVKVDPGSKETGIAVVREDEEETHHALYFINLKHRGAAIRDALTSRRQLRRGRRSRNLRYRAPRFLNRSKPKGWLPPSLQHRVDTTLSWVNRLRRLAPVSGIAQELVKFDTQLMQNPDISGVEYQQGELAGYELKEYLLEKFGRRCVYCAKSDVPLNVEHIVPKARGGSNRLSNLAIACVECNQKKGAKPIEEFLKGKPELLARVRKQLKTPLRDAASVNATRWALFHALSATGLPVRTGSGALTKFNRHCFGVPKEHWFDALCVGRINGVSYEPGMKVLNVSCTGRGQYKRTRTDKFGFPICHFMRTKRPHGVGLGDLVRMTVQKGKHPGIWTGRAFPSNDGRVVLILPEFRIWGRARNCSILSLSDGYGYRLTDSETTKPTSFGK